MVFVNPRKENIIVHNVRMILITSPDLYNDVRFKDVDQTQDQNR